MNRFGLAIAGCAAIVSACAQELVFTPGATLGINVPAPERNRWKARNILPADYDRKASAECREADFFTLEYGKPLESFALDVTEKGASRLWGERFDDHSGQAIRFGRGWASYDYAHAEVRADIDQAGEGETDWTLFYHSRTGKKSLLSFKTKPGANGICQHLELIRLSKLYRDGGLELVAKGKAGVRATVKDLRILPVRNWVSYRRRFTLAAAPWQAGLSFREIPGTTVTVNGRAVTAPDYDNSGYVAKVDLTKALSAGENEVVVTIDGGSGWDRSPVFAAEVFAVAPDGALAFFPTDGSWEAKSSAGDWKKPQVLDVYGVERMSSGTKYATGRVPLHAGALQVKPRGTPWPVFASGASAAWDVELPPALADAKVVAAVRNVVGGSGVSPLCKRSAENGGSGVSPLTVEFDLPYSKHIDWRSHREAAARVVRDAASPVVLPSLAPGAYEIDWTLVVGGKTVDSERSEMLVIGSLGLDELPAEEVESALRRRMRLVQEIDCTAEAPADALLDHSGYYGKHVTNVGRVVERDGFKVRETGPGWLDLLSWKIGCGTLGAPHIVEVDIPDTCEQYAYASVSETFPVNFCNNSFPVGMRSWPNASGSAFTGGIFPLSGKMKTFRFVVFPTSRNLTFNVENGKYGKPVGLSRVRIYEVAGTLPAMRIPPTERVFANHNERPLFFNWGNAVNPFMQEYDGSYREGMWAGCYQALVNRVQQLRFFGHNAALEGALMYYYIFKTKSGQSFSTDASFDPLVPMVMMYRANGIRTYLGYEYTSAPALLRNGIRDVSDREVAAGKPTLSFVDRYGRQTYGMAGGWMNFMDPRTESSMQSILKEIYDRYEPLGVEGLVLQTDGCGWQPTFNGVTSRQDPDEVGYDDQTFGLFEKETGFRMDGGSGVGGSGVSPLSAERFANRYAAVHANAKALAKWRDWRFGKVAEAHRKLAAIVRTRTPWRYVFAPDARTPFVDRGYTRANYPKDGPIEILPTVSFNKEWDMKGYADAFADVRFADVREFDSVYLTPYGLNEHNFNRVDGAKRWWWRSYDVIVYDMLPVGENAFFDCVSFCRERTPKLMLHTWLDVNIPTAHDAESRRFLNGFYATPVAEPRPYAGATGVTAHLYGEKLQLLNLTPYAVVEKGGLTVPPWGVVVLDGEAASRRFVSEAQNPGEAASRRFVSAAQKKEDSILVQSGETPLPRRPLPRTPRPLAFAFDDAGQAAVAKIKATVADARVQDVLSSAAKAKWVAASDDYARAVLSREPEFLDTLLKFEAAQTCFVRQRRFEELLAKDGVVRVDCGFCAGERTDELGAVWLPDQDDTGFRAYGSANGVRTSRGEIPILKTDRPSVYRTEMSETGKGALVYRFPVPEGRYTVRVHIADTFNKEDRGVKWEFGVGADRRRVNIWELAGGTGKTATVSVFEHAQPKDGVLTVDFTCSVVNGIEIEREK